MKLFWLGQDKLKIVYFTVLDKLRLQLDMRRSGYAIIYDKLNFWFNIDKSIGTDDVVRNAEKLTNL